MDKRKIVLFGCSFSVDLKKQGFDNDVKGPNHNYIVDDRFTHGGSSNQRIVEDVYNYINSDEYSNNDRLNIQWTYNNRLWISSNLVDNHYSSHSLSNSMLWDSNVGLSKYLQKFYELYIALFYDNKLMFKEQLKQIDLLRTYMDSKNVKYFQYLHSVDSHYHETSTPMHNDSDNYNPLDVKKQNSKRLPQGDDYTGWNNIAPPIKDGNIVDLKKYNLQSIEGCRCLGEWASRENYHTSKNNIHLSIDGNVALATFLIKKINAL